MKTKKLCWLLQYCTGRVALHSRHGGDFFGCSADHVLSMILLVTIILLGGTAYGQGSSSRGDAGQIHTQSEHGNLAEIGAKLSNPVSDVWALFTEFDLTFSDGDINKGSWKTGGRMLFQPILPIPLYGEGTNEWKLITRPTIPVIFSEPVPKGYDKFRHLGGLGDTQFPMLVSPPAGNWLLGLGPTWLIPTATREEFGKDQWGAGPAFILGYHTKKWIAGTLPQYTFGIGGWNGKNEPYASYLSMLYFFVYNLHDAWQIGTNPTITYDDRAPSDNKWNIPIGPFVAKTTKIGKMPVKIQLGFEYSVVHQDDYGQRAQVKLNIIPVIPSLIKNPIFGK